MHLCGGPTPEVMLRVIKTRDPLLCKARPEAGPGATPSTGFTSTSFPTKIFQGLIFWGLTCVLGEFHPLKQ